MVLKRSTRQLRNHKWYGNIEELKNIIQAIVVSSTDSHDVITQQKLAPIIGEKNIQFVEEQSMHKFNSIDQATEEFTKNFLLYLLKKNYYNINQVSQRLSLSPTQLKNKLLELF